MDILLNFVRSNLFVLTHLLYLQCGDLYVHFFRKQHFLYFFPLPHGQGLFRPIFCETIGFWGGEGVLKEYIIYFMIIIGKFK
jgi:hypothetical protein